MKITSIEIIRTPDDGRASDGTRWRPTFIRVNTDEGISGFGEIGLAYSDAIDAATGILKDFCPIIIGMDPTKTECFAPQHLLGSGWRRRSLRRDQCHRYGIVGYQGQDAPSAGLPTAGRKNQ